MKWGGKYCGTKRLIKKPMGAKRVHLAGFFLAILCMFMTGFSEVNRRFVDEASHNNGGHSTSQEIDENAAEQVWIYCKKELGELTKTINDFDLYSNDNLKRDITSSRKTLLHKAITDLPPQLKQSLLLSLKSKRFPSHVSGKDGCQECLSKLYSLNVDPRTGKIHHRPRKRRQHPHRSLGSEHASPVPANSLESYRKRLSIQDSLRVEKKAIPKPRNKLPDHVLLIGIIVSTAVATLALFILFLICCLGGNEKTGSQCGQEDEKPVVDVCVGRVSGASQMSAAVESNKDLIHYSTTNLSGSIASQTPEIGKLPLPPGRAAQPPQPPPAAAPPPPPPPKPLAPKAPPPPPPPSGVRPPNPPKLGNIKRPAGLPLPVGPRDRGPPTSGDENGCGSANSKKTKLKPLFWDKVNFNHNRSMVWNELNAGSFQ